MNPIIVNAATHRELSFLLKTFLAREIKLPGCQAVYEASMGSLPVLFAVTGVGKANTAMGVTSLLSARPPQLLINTGCCGAYEGSGLRVRDLALATHEIFGDEGVETRDGWLSLEDIGLPLCSRNGTRYFNEFPLSTTAVERADVFAAASAWPVARGRFVTVSTCSGTAERGGYLSSRFRAACENMEGAAAVHVATAHGIECMEIRGVSNMVEDRDLSRWDIDGAVARVQEFLAEFLIWFANGRLD